MKVSVVTPTVRKEGLEVIHQCLKKQTHTDWEWLIGSKFDPEIPEAIWVKDDFKDGYWTLNRIYNKLFETASSDIIISWQDWIWVQPDGIEKWLVDLANCDGIFTAVGDQYERLNKWGKPEINIWHDPRREYVPFEFGEIDWRNSEWNWAAIPKKYLYQVGGMDEDLDFLGYGGDQYQICSRLAYAGVKFYMDKSNESFTVRHNRSAHGGQQHWDDNHVLMNGKYEQESKKLVTEDRWPNVGFLRAK